MMIDRFDAQLRQHLLDTANERPAAGQIGRVVELVAGTRQRHPLIARRTWFTPRFGAVPSRSVRYALVAVALLLAVAAAGIVGSGNSAGTTVFEGRWTSTDPEDGSARLLVVGAGRTPAVRFRDLFASGAPCLDDPTKVFTADGSASVDGEVLHVVFPKGGGCGTRTVAVGAADYAHDDRTGTLTDHAGVRWERAQDDAVVPQPTNVPTEPRPDATPDAAGPVFDCIDLVEGDSYTAAAGSVVLTATVPVGSTNRWQGDRDSFGLTSSCSTDGRIFIAVAPITEGRADSCIPGSSIDARTFDDAVAGLAGEKGEGIAEPLNLTIDGHAAVRFDVTNLAACPGGFGLQGGVILGEGETGSIYVIDAESALLSIEVNWSGATRAQIDDARAIVASLQIEP